MNFKIGAMTDSFKKSFRESLDKAVEVGAEGIQLYVTGGEMLYSNLDDAKLEEVKKLLAERNLVSAVTVLKAKKKTNGRFPPPRLLRTSQRNSEARSSPLTSALFPQTNRATMTA